MPDYIIPEERAREWDPLDGIFRYALPREFAKYLYIYIYIYVYIFIYIYIYTYIYI